MDSFIVSARKYRPRRFEEVVGQESVTGTLKKAITSGHLAHAFLFCGPRGVGKTTCARILARMINAPDPANYNPDESPEINDSFNIYELDAASNNSVDDIRSLVDQVRFPPQSGKYKVYIIDEVHMLSQAAFNAFLKTLEEPPPYAIFILATTEKHKIIPTILSRCQIFDFNRITINDTVQHLQTICDTESLKADPGALHIIAEKADGALRDALSLFDRLADYQTKELTYEGVITQLNILDYDYFFKVCTALLAQDVSNVLLIFDEVLRKGFEGDNFLGGLSTHFRNLMVAKDEKTVKLLEVSGDLKERYLQQAAMIPQTFLLNALNLANQCELGYKTSKNKRLHVELALMKMCHIPSMLKIKAVQPTEQIQPEKKTTVAPEPKTVTKPTPTQEAPGKEAIPVEPLQKEVVTEEKEEAEPTVTVHKEPEQPTTQEQASKALSTEKLDADAAALTGSAGFNFNNLEAGNTKEKEETEKQASENLVIDPALFEKAWGGYLDYLKGQNKKALYGFMPETQPIVEGNKVLIKVDSAYKEELLLNEKTNISDYLETQLNGRPEVVVEVDKSTKENQPRKAFTSQERFDRLAEENPSLNDLKEQLGLKFE